MPCAALVLGPRGRALRIQAPDVGDLEHLLVATNFFRTDIPGENNAGPVVHDEPLLPIKTTYSYQPVGIVLSEDRGSASDCEDVSRRGAAGLCSINYCWGN